MGRKARATNLEVTREFLRERRGQAAEYGYSKAKWIVFCEMMLTCGYHVTLYEARFTKSKYVTVSVGEKQYKVRFSNHKPIKARELAGDCDFFVGRTNLKFTNTYQAIRATVAALGKPTGATS